MGCARIKPRSRIIRSTRVEFVSEKEKNQYESRPPLMKATNAVKGIKPVIKSCPQFTRRRVADKQKKVIKKLYSTLPAATFTRSVSTKSLVRKL